MTTNIIPTDHIVVFNDTKIHRTFHNDEWWFVVVDVIAALTDSKDPSNYLKNMRRRDPELAKGGGQIDTPLSFETAGGKQKLNRNFNLDKIFSTSLKFSGLASQNRFFISSN